LQTRGPGSSPLHPATATQPSLDQTLLVLLKKTHERTGGQRRGTLARVPLQRATSVTLFRGSGPLHMKASLDTTPAWHCTTWSGLLLLLLPPPLLRVVSSVTTTGSRRFWTLMGVEAPPPQDRRSCMP
jgi:hypothetical protein